ncbi:MAG: SPOR domain-containing protein [Thermodesulfobacteriota bacterium]
MPSETILVVDAGQDIDERMTSTLEAENYLTYDVSSQDVNTEMADLLKPSLIYVMPPDLRPTGLNPCKAIHGIPLLMRVPIVILASLKKAPGPTYLEEYGIVDFLKPTFSPEELIEKTRTILGKTPPPGNPEEEEPDTLRAVRGTEKKRSALLLPAVGITVILGIAGAGYMAYQKFMPSQKGPPSVAVKTPARVPSAAPQVGLKPQLPPASNVKNTPSTTPTTTPAATPAATPVPASSVPSAPPVQPSSASSESPSQPPGAVRPADSDPTPQTSKTHSPKPFYSVQLGAFRDVEIAEALTKKFQEKGYDAFTRSGVTKDRSPIYRVLVNKYDDRKAAQKMAGEIETREQVKTILYGE